MLLYIIIFVLCGIIAFQNILHSIERKDLYNRIMCGSAAEYKNIHNDKSKNPISAHDRVMRRWRTTDNPDALGNDYFDNPSMGSGALSDYLANLSVDNFMARYDDTNPVTNFIAGAGFRSAGNMLGSMALAEMSGIPGAVNNFSTGKAALTAKNIASTTPVGKAVTKGLTATPNITKLAGTGKLSNTANKAIGAVNSLSGEKVLKFLNPLDNPTTAVMGLTSAQDKYDQLLQMGYDKTTAASNALFTGYVNAVTEKMGYDGTPESMFFDGKNILSGKTSLSKSKNAANTLKKYLKSNVSEGIEEVYATVFERTADTLTGVGYVDENGVIKQRPGFGNEGIFDFKNIGESFLGGFIGGAVMGGAGIISDIANADYKDLKDHYTDVQNETNSMKRKIDDALKNAGIEDIEVPKSPDWKTADIDEINKYYDDVVEVFNRILNDERVILHDNNVIEKENENIRIKYVDNIAANVNNAGKVTPKEAGTAVTNTANYISRETLNTVHSSRPNEIYSTVLRFIASPDNTFTSEHVEEYAKSFVDAMSDVNGMAYKNLSSKTNDLPKILTDYAINKTVPQEMEDNKLFDTTANTFTNMLERALGAEYTIYNGIYENSPNLDVQMEAINNGDFSVVNQKFESQNLDINTGTSANTTAETGSNINMPASANTDNAMGAGTALGNQPVNTVNNSQIEKNTDMNTTDVSSHVNVGDVYIADIDDTVYTVTDRNDTQTTVEVTSDQDKTEMTFSNSDADYIFKEATNGIRQVQTGTGINNEADISNPAADIDKNVPSKTIRLTQVGDFYEAYGDDAVDIADKLDLTLTTISKNGKRIQMVGFPTSRLNDYKQRLGSSYNLDISRTSSNIEEKRTSSKQKITRAKKKDWASHDVEWIAPSSNTVIAYSTVSSKDLIDMMATDNPKMSIAQMYDAITYDQESKKVLKAYIDNGFGEEIASHYFGDNYNITENNKVSEVKNAEDSKAVTESIEGDRKSNKNIFDGQLIKDYNAAVDNIISVSDDAAKEFVDKRVAVEVLKNTPNVILKNVKDAKDLKVIISYNNLYLAVRKDGVLKGHYHNLGTEISKKLPDFLEEPDAIIQLENGRLNILSSVESERGNNGIISVELNSTKDIAGKYEDYNVIVTIFTSDDNYIKNLISKDGVSLKYEKEDLSQVNPQLYKWLAIINDKSSYTRSITQEESGVNISDGKVQQKTPVLTDKCELIPTKHTKTGEDIWVVTLKDKLSADDYKDLNSRVKKAGGYYSRFAKTPDGKAIPGFIFKTKPDAAVFKVFNDFFGTEGKSIQSGTPEAFEENSSKLSKSIGRNLFASSSKKSAQPETVTKKRKILSLNHIDNIHSLFKDSKRIVKGLDLITDGKFVIPYNAKNLSEVKKIYKGKITENNNLTLSQFYNKDNSIVIQGNPKVYEVTVQGEHQNAYAFTIDGKIYSCLQKFIDAFNAEGNIIRANSSLAVPWTVHNKNGDLIGLFMPLIPQENSYYKNLPTVSQILDEQQVGNNNSENILKMSLANDTMEESNSIKGADTNGIDGSTENNENDNRFSKLQSSGEERTVDQRMSGTASENRQEGQSETGNNRILETRTLETLVNDEKFNDLSKYIGNEISADRYNGMFYTYLNDSRIDEGYDFSEVVAYDMLTNPENSLRELFGDNIAEYFGDGNANTDISGQEVDADTLDKLKNTVVKNKNGQIIPLYHSTDEVFSEFKSSDIGIHFGSYSQAIQRAKDKGNKNPIFVRAYLNITNPLYIDEDFFGWNAFQISQQLKKMKVISNNEARGYYNTSKESVEEGNASLVDLLKSKGYDGIIYNNKIEAINGKSYIVFDNNQIIRADRTNDSINSERGAAENEQRGNDTLSEDTGRYSYAGAAVKGKSIFKSGGRDLEYKGRQQYVENLNRGTDTEIAVRHNAIKGEFIKEKAYNDDMRKMVEHLKALGFKNVGFFVGTAQVAYKPSLSSNATVFRDTGEIYLRYDDPDFSPRQLAVHEYGHSIYNSKLGQKIRNIINNSLPLAERNAIMRQKRYRMYLKILNDPDLVFEEFVCDVLGGMSDYSYTHFEELINAFWSRDYDVIDGYAPAEYTESIDAGGINDALNNMSFGNKYSFNKTQKTKIKYSAKGIKLPAAEYKKFESSVSTDYYLPYKTHTGLQYQSCVTDKNHILYVYEDGGFGNYNPVARIDYADADIANAVMEKLKNEENYQITRVINNILKIPELGRSGYTLYNAYTKKRVSSRGNGVVSKRTQKSNTIRTDGNGSRISRAERGNGNIKLSLSDDGYFDLLSLTEGKYTDAEIKAHAGEFSEKLIEKYGAIPKGEKPARKVNVPKKISEAKPVSHFARTMMEAGITPDENISDFEVRILDGTMTHETITNKKAAQYAADRIKSLGFDEALRSWETLSRERKVGKKELALGMELYNQCITNKDVTNAMKIAAELAAEATRAGQTLQATRMLKLMSPDAQLYYIEKSLQKMNEEFREKLGDKYKDIELDESLMRKFFSSKNEEEQNKIYDKICQNIADQIPATFMDKWNSWRYLAMLGNPRTHIRNIIGNAVFVPAVRLKDFTGAVIETAVGTDKAKRVFSFSKSKEAVNFAKKDFEVMSKVLQGENAKYAVTSDIEGKRTIFTSKWFKWLETLRRKNFEWLEKEDIWFLKAHYVDALARIITVRSIDPKTASADVLEKARTYAIKEAQAATYRDANAIAEALNRIQKNLSNNENKAARAAGILIEGVMPFKKTPLNIAKQGVNYSPVGLMFGVYKAAKRLKDGTAYSTSDVINSLATGLTGTAIMLIGMFLSKLGIIQGSDDDSKKKKNFDKMLGEQDYSLNIGDLSYTIDWLTPLCLPLFIGAELDKLTKDEFSFGKVVEAVTKLTDPLLELSVLSGVSSAIEAAQYNETNEIFAIMSDMTASYLTQALPTLGGQFSRIIDKRRRDYYFVNKNSDVPKALQTLIGQAASKVPFASYLFAPQVDDWGREKTYGGLLERVVENTLSPGYYSQKEYTKVDKELLRLYEETGDNSVLPTTQQKYYVQNKVYYYMDAHTYNKVKKIRGQRAFKLVKEFIDSSEYKKLTDSEKVKQISNLYKDAGDYAKDKMFDKVKKGVAK